MTQQGYGRPVPPETLSRPGWTTPVKVLVATTLVLEGAGGAAVAGFVALIVYSGCFLSCTGANHAGGLLLGLLASVLLVGGPCLATVMWRRARSPRAVLIWAGLALCGPGLYVVGGFGGAF